jgi:hypothetical protein
MLKGTQRVSERTGDGATNRAGRLYWPLLALQVVGAAIIMSQGVPLYRSFLPGRDLDPAEADLFAWALLGVLLLQVLYWTATLKVFPHAAIPKNLFGGHVAYFVARLNFVLASSLFVVIVFVRSAEIEFVWWRALTLVAVLFAIFCFSLELERLGRRMAVLFAILCFSLELERLGRRMMEK